jgi:hypothetical protein
MEQIVTYKKYKNDGKRLQSQTKINVILEKHGGSYY